MPDRYVERVVWRQQQENIGLYVLLHMSLSVSEEEAFVAKMCPSCAFVCPLSTRVGFCL